MYTKSIFSGIYILKYSIAVCEIEYTRGQIGPTSTRPCILCILGRSKDMFVPTPLLKVQINLFTMHRLSVIQCLFLKLLLADSCFICGKSAQWWCAECMTEVQQFENPVYFCLGCSESIHGRPHRIGHKVEMAQARLELLSVICIETSHYVCFTRAENRWIFFDSMANRACK